jgi:hypothetical protein
MHNLLGIYAKRKDKFFEVNFSDVIDVVNGSCNPKNDNIYISENFFPMPYCDSDVKGAYIINDIILYSNSGYVYFHESPNGDKNFEF